MIHLCLVYNLMTTEFLPVDPADPFLIFCGGGGPLPAGGNTVDLMSFKRSSILADGPFISTAGVAGLMAGFLGKTLPS